MPVYDIIVNTGEEESYLLGTLFDREFAEFILEIALQMFPEHKFTIDTRQITENPKIFQYTLKNGPS